MVLQRFPFWYETYDQHTKKLEKAVTDYLQVKYGIVTHCCTLALHLACATLGLKEGDEVICTDFSWVATAYAISYTGAKPVFVDIDPDSWCIDPQAIEKAITTKTKAIMLVHCFGHPAQMDEIMQIANKHNLKVIEDAAPSLGAEFKGQKTGTFGDIGCFSFQGAKIAVSGEGGIFVTNNKDLYKKALLLSSMGRTDSQAVFWSDMLGYQYTIANLTAALALAQVERIEELVAKKREIFSWYYERLKNIKGIKIIKEKKDCKSNYCYPSILLQESVKVSRDEVLEKLKALNIHCRPGFPRMSRFPVFEARFPNPEAEKVEKRGISLAAAGNLTQKDVHFVCDSLLEIIK
ncbi:MAG: DegT/DnrJ/EryC1/StrS family aminotransferase [Candidatus Omnitrophica bacterium]|nr:DegT/DnrJ/EryC1/StrS family aminotransferase [Candidatus Omnitrophota bacterium]